jgi:flagellar biogenesis protein FliO
MKSLAGVLCSSFLIYTAHSAPDLDDLDDWEIPSLSKQSSSIQPIESLRSEAKPKVSTPQPDDIMDGAADFYLRAGTDTGSKREESSKSFGLPDSFKRRPLRETNDGRREDKLGSNKKPQPPYLKNGNEDLSDKRASSFSFGEPKPLSEGSHSTQTRNMDPANTDSSYRPSTSAQRDPIKDQTISKTLANGAASTDASDRANSPPLWTEADNKKEEAMMRSEDVGTATVYSLLFLTSVIFLYLWYQKQIKGRLKTNHGLPIETLGQTWLDGQTKVVILRVGSKVLVLAKSSSFCTTLDTITDPEEINLLTLGSGAMGQEDFTKLLKQFKKNSSSFAKVKDPIPNENEIRNELSQLKSELSDIGGKV